MMMPVAATTTESIVRGVRQLLLLLLLLLTVGLSGCSEDTDSTSASIGPQETKTDRRHETPSEHAAGRASGVDPELPLTRFSFEAIGAESGFEFQRYDDMRGQRRILEVNGGGVAIFDFDADGWMDIFMPNGCRLPLSEDRRETPGKLFRNRRSRQFQDDSRPSGLRQFGFCYGCTAADVNNDGFCDLYITAIGGNQLWLNHGDGTFTEAASDSGVEVGRWGSSAAFADLNQDGHLDLYVANYLDESDTEPTLCPEPASPDGFVGCSPAIIPGIGDTLLLSDGAGQFIDASAQSGLDQWKGKALGVAICDLGGDLTPEIYVANDGEPNLLFAVEVVESAELPVAAVRLTDHALTSSTALNDHGYAQASMGIAVIDIDRDGAMDLFLTHFFGDTNTLYLNHSSDTVFSFQDATRRSALGPSSRMSLGFGTVAIDVDSDGWHDLAIANGHVDDRTWMKLPEPFRMSAQVYQNLRDATFADVSALAGDYFQQPRLGRGLARGDLDHDGRVDLVVSNQLDPSAVLCNNTPPVGETLSLRLVGVGSNRSAIGAQVRLLAVSPVMQSQLEGGGGFQSSNEQRIRFGGLQNTAYDVEIIWPDKRRQTVSGLYPGEYTCVQFSCVVLDVD